MLGTYTESISSAVRSRGLRKFIGVTLGERCGAPGVQKAIDYTYTLHTVDQKMSDIA